MAKNRNGFKAMIEACQIFNKYSDCYSPFHCEHDELSVCEVSPRNVSEEDTKRLQELGFECSYDDEDGDYFYSFRFGSC